MKYFIGVFLFLISFFAFAGENPVNPEKVKLELINSMTQDGYLSQKMSYEVKQKYINTEKLSQQAAATVKEQKHTAWTDYFSLINFIKVGGILLILFAFWGTIQKIIKGLWHLIIKVPDYIYQAILLSTSLMLTFIPEVFWTSQAFYLALFGSIGNIIIIGWIFTSYPKVAQFFAKLFNLGIPLASVVSFWGMIYFGSLSLYYQSQIFGFFAMVCLSGIFSFTLYYNTGTLWLYFKENALSAVVFGHLVVIGIYVTLHLNHSFSEKLPLFSVGLEYYCTIALCTGLLVGSAPWHKAKDIGLYVLLFIITFVLAIVGYFLGDLKVIGSIVTCFFILFCLEWIGYLGFKGGLLVGTAMLGGSLYGLALILEKYSSFFILNFLA